MKVVNISDKKTNEEQEAERKAERKASCLQILEEMRIRVESGEIEEFVAASTDSMGEVQIHCAIKDYLAGVGLMDVGKYTLTKLTVMDYDWEE